VASPAEPASAAAVAIAEFQPAAPPASLHGAVHEDEEDVDNDSDAISSDAGVVEDDYEQVVEAGQQAAGNETEDQADILAPSDTRSIVADAVLVSPADHEHGIGIIREIADVASTHLAAGACSTQERSSKAFAAALGSAMLGEISYAQAFEADRGRAIHLERDPAQMAVPAFDALSTAQFARDMGLGAGGSDTDHHQTFEAACGFKLTSQGITETLERVASLRSAPPSQVRKALLSAARTPQTEERCLQLAKLHPPAREADMLEPSFFDTAEIDTWSDDYLSELLEKAAERGKAGKAVGPDGVSHKTVLMLGSDPRMPLVHLLRRALTGTLTDDESSLLTSATLLAIPKESGGARPIAIGGGVSRLFSRVLHHLGKDRWQMASSGNFCGLRDGAVAACHTLRHAFETHEDLDVVAIAIDCSNAFNTISRSLVQERVRAVTPELEPLFLSLYGVQARLFYRTQDNRFLCLASEQGMPQGAAAASSLFALGIASSVETTRALFPAVSIVTYADDVTIVGSVCDAAKAAGCLSRLLTDVAGLQVKPSKTQIICKPDPMRLEIVRERLATLLHGAEGECVSPAMIQNTEPIRVLGGCVTPSVGDASPGTKEMACMHHLTFTLRLLRGQYGAGLELLQRGMDELGPVGTTHYVGSVLSASLSYLDRAAGLSQDGTRECMHAMICHALVIKSLKLQVDPFLSCGFLNPDEFSREQVEAKRFDMMVLFDKAIGHLLGLSGEPNAGGQQMVWTGSAERLIERESFLALFATCPESLRATLAPTPHRDLSAEGTYSKRFTRAARLGLQAGGLGVPGFNFFMNSAAAGWLGTISRGVRGGLDTNHMTAKQLELKEQAPAGHAPVCGTVEGDVRTIGGQIVEPPDPGGDGAGESAQPSNACRQPSEVLSTLVSDGAPRHTQIGWRTMMFMLEKRERAQRAREHILKVSYCHNGANRGALGGPGPGAADGELDGDALDEFWGEAGAAALDVAHENDPVFGKDSWLTQSSLVKAVHEERRAFGLGSKEVIAEYVKEQVTEGIQGEAEYAQIVDSYGLEDAVELLIDEIDDACVWRVFILTMTGQTRTASEYMVDEPMLNDVFRVLPVEMLSEIDHWVSDQAGPGLMKAGADTKVQWLKLLLAHDTNTDRLEQARSLVTEFSALVEAIRLCDGDGETAVTEQDIAASPACVRILKRLAHMRDVWQPASATWLRRMVSKGERRLSDASFIALLRYRLAASRCNDLIGPGEEVACGCAMAEPLRGDGDVTTQFHLARCAKGRSRTIAWHHGIKHALARMLKSLKLDVKIEPTSYAPGDDQFAPTAGAATNRRPDLHVTNKLTGLSALVDVTVTAVTNATSCMAAFRNPARPLEIAAKRKHKVYANSPNTKHFTGEVVPFVVGSNGILGEEGFKWLRKVAGPILDRQTKVQARRWRFFWFSYLSEACATGLAAQLLSQTSRLEAQVGRARRTTSGTMGAGDEGGAC
jgi:hypothetical protein